jgi:glyoxylase-like metal-dependent hydrolase (beta-lactamase superfamily II)
MLENRKWQPAPGMEHTLLYPIINKTNLTTSNSFIFHAPSMVVIIDPGNFGEQIAAIRQALAGAPEDRSRPVIACLTHCHVDHCFEFISNPPAVAADAHIFAAIQENGFHAVSRKDRELTAAGTYRKTIPDPNLDICLLSAEDRRFNVSKKFMLMEGMQLKMTTETLTASGGNTLHKQDLYINENMIRVYYTPGHSPDSVSFQMGDILFVGDAMFASDHFIAGLPGWDKGNALASAENLLWLLENEHISLVAQGHGDVMTADKASGKLRKMIDKLPGIKMRKELDSQAILASSEHAVDVSREAIDIMTAMAESLSHVVCYLDFLEESEAALNYAASLDSGKLGELFSTFNEMAEQMHSGRLIELKLIIKSAVLFNRIKCMLKSEGLECVVGKTLLGRLERLFDDYIEDASGRDIKQDITIVEARSFLKGFTDALKEDVHADESIFDTLDDEKAFVKSLIRRMAYKAVYKDVNFVIDEGPEVMIRSDRGRLEEILEIIVEAMVEEGSKQIVFSVSENEGSVSISIEAGLIPGILMNDGYQKRAMLRRVGWIDGSLSLKAGEDSAVVALAFASENSGT